MVETLRDDAFPPLHYELLWWLKEGGPLPVVGRIVPGGFYLTPVFMRIVPAICGTLMPLAMYFLGRQLLTRRASLIVAGLTATSAYMLWFSRDAKMYMPLWFFTTLSVACLLWWLRTASWTAWLCWIATALAAVGHQMIAMLVIALTPLIALTARRFRWTTTLLMFAGLAVIGAGPAGYYLGFNKWSERSGGVMPGATGEMNPQADWELSGLNWIGTQPDRPMVIAGTISTWLTCFEMRPGMVRRDGDTSGSTSYISRIAWWCRATLIVTGAFMLVGTMPWSRRMLGYRNDDESPEPAWRVLLWLGCWIAVIAYGFFFCRSVDEPPSPWMLFGNVGFVVPAIGWVILTMVFSWCRNDWRVGTVRIGQLFAATLMVMALCYGVWWTIGALHDAAIRKNPGVEWRTIWHTRYVAIVWPAVMLVVAALLDRVPGWPLRAVAIAMLVAANVTSGLARITQDSQYRFDLVWQDVWSDKPGGDVRTYVDLGMGGGGPLPATPYWRMVNAYYGVETGQVKTSPPEFRRGKVWPFVFGQVFDRVRDTINIRPYADDGRIGQDVSDAMDVQHVVVWRPTLQQEPPQIAGFRLLREDVYVARWAWTWQQQGSLTRYEFAR